MPSTILNSNSNSNNNKMKSGKGEDERIEKFEKILN